MTRMLSCIWLVTTESDFTREEGTCLIAYQNAALNKRGGGDKYTGAKGGEVGSLNPGVLIGLKVKVVDEMVAAEILLRWGQKIVGNGVFVL